MFVTGGGKINLWIALFIVIFLYLLLVDRIFNQSNNGVRSRAITPAPTMKDVSPNDLRIEAIDRYRSVFWSAPSNHDNDLFREPFPQIDIKVIVATTNPQPVYMLWNPATRNQLHWQGTYHTEKAVRWTLRLILNTHCRRHHGAFVIDIGANEGFYSLLAAAYGCRVTAVEPQPLCVAWMSASIAFNNFKHPVNLLNRYVDLIEGKMLVNKNECDGMNQMRENSKAKETVEIKSIGLTDLMPSANEDILVIHMDVEGMEVPIMRMLIGYAHRIKNIVYEMNRNWWKENGITTENGDATLETIMAFGFVCRDLSSNGYPVLAKPLSKHFVNDATDIWCTSMPEYMDVIPASSNENEMKNDQTQPKFLTIT